jgi:hypothetical protein
MHRSKERANLIRAIPIVVIKKHQSQLLIRPQICIIRFIDKNRQINKLSRVTLKKAVRSYLYSIL